MADAQFEKARLYAASGKFAESLSEYEDVLEWMEKETEDMIERRRRRIDIGIDVNDDDSAAAADDHDDALPVIHGAAALNGVGVTKLLLHLRDRVGGKEGDDGGGRRRDANVDIDELLEGLDTATEILLESRGDASTSPDHYQLAIDLGLAASIALANAGAARILLIDDCTAPDGVGHRRRALELWHEGISTLDSILVNASNSLIVIPRHKFVCMESVRARLYCNIAWTLLGFPTNHPSSSPDGGVGGVRGVGGDDTASTSQKVSDENLRDASDAAKRALDIYDELMNGPKFMRDGVIDDGDGEKSRGGEDEDVTTDREWEEILRDAAAEGRDDDGTSKTPAESPLSPLWAAYHKCESARALGLVARCYALAGSAVTAEGLFQAALDASSSHPFGRKYKSGAGGSDRTRGGARAETGVSLSSPNLGLIARDVRCWYAMLCDDWDRRGGDAARLRSDASMIEDEGALRGYVRDANGAKRSVSGMESSLWLFSPSNFK
jgi:hypothetical protein